jgi:hypothetical protein
VPRWMALRMVCSLAPRRAAAWARVIRSAVAVGIGEGLACQPVDNRVAGT